MRTLKFKAHPTNSFFANVNQMFGGSSQLRTTAVRCFFVWTVLKDWITVCSVVVGSWEEPPTEHLIDGSEKRIVGWALNFRVCMLLSALLFRDSSVPNFILFFKSLNFSKFLSIQVKMIARFSLQINVISQQKKIQNRTYIKFREIFIYANREIKVKSFPSTEIKWTGADSPPEKAHQNRRVLQSSC